MNLELLKNILFKHKSQLRECGVVSLKVFGSIARNEAHSESDVDLLVEFDDRPLDYWSLLHLSNI